MGLFQMIGKFEMVGINWNENECEKPLDLIETVIQCVLPDHLFNIC